MTNIKRVRLIYGIILSVALILAGLLLISACICVYRAGPYTPESVALHFSKIAVPVYIALALWIGSIVLHIALPADKEKRKIQKNYALILRKLWERREEEFCGPTLLKDIRKEQTLRKRMIVINYIVLALFSIVFMVFSGLQMNRFLRIDDPLVNISGGDLSKSILFGTILILACLIIPFGYALATVYRTRASIQREINLVKGIAPSREKAPVPEKKDRTDILRWVLLGAAIVSIAYGYFAGGSTDVLGKAINICTECIGLG